MQILRMKVMVLSLGKASPSKFSSFFLSQFSQEKSNDFTFKFHIIFLVGLLQE